ncbi:helix-turn-helix transcriptional regulator [Providencia rettgeri]|uniref:helix-turn-helix domain-containing protein n=1 Tax=Providencia rettgeri TaxID=587 RepID=UPI0029DBAA10|nr:helix-turn-helix transcriptional regulator [Providencia rettgeri]MDX7324201.1 helix-turn-helix transcriptional regulator [Providencia rettgeri]
MVTNDTLQCIIKFCEQVDTLLFQSLESTSPSASQNLVEMALEKNNEIKNQLTASKYTKPKTEQTVGQSTFSERLKFALKEQGMTQGVLADWTGISQSTISSMATGKIKNIDTPRAEAIAKALSVSFTWLMNGEGSIYGSDFLTNGNEV